MIRLPGLTAAIVLAAVPAQAQPDLPALRQGTPYAQARADLVRAGHRPIPSREGLDRCGSREEICRAYPEAEACAGTGRAPCSFTWRTPQGGAFAVTTLGEELARLSVNRVIAR